MKLRRRKEKPQTPKGIIILIALLFASYFAYNFFYNSKESGKNTEPIKINLKDKFILERTEKNYGKEIDSVADLLEVNPNYLKALIALECSGRKEFKPRFEKHVFNRLKAVRDGKRKNYGSITKRTINGSSDAALKNLATSWGPFQLMGYQCIELQLKVFEIRGKESVYWGTVWIKKRYGKYLKKKKYKDAFHIHNTGSPYPLLGKPKTHDPKYVERGLNYIRFFENREVTKAEN